MNLGAVMIPPKPVEPSKPRNSLVKAVIASEAPRLSEQFTHLIAMLSAYSVQLRDILAVMHGRAYTLLLILLSLPFCQPIPLPGSSTPFGVVIALIGRATFAASRSVVAAADPRL